MKSLVEDLVVTCGEIEYTPVSPVINSCDRTNYWVIDIVKLAITFLLLLLVIVVKYYIKIELTIPCLLSY